MIHPTILSPFTLKPHWNPIGCALFLWTLNTVPGAEWVWSGYECFSQGHCMMSDISLFQCVQMNSVKTWFGDFLELGCNQGFLAQSSVDWPLCSLHCTSDSLGRSFWQHLPGCSIINLIDFSVSFWARTVLYQFILHRINILPSNVILNL